MKSPRTRIVWYVGVFVVVMFDTAAAITIGQVDDFEDGTVMNWGEGPFSPNPATNISTGGPDGSGDAYLQDVSSGGLSTGGKLVMFNTTQWSGDYLSENVARITADMANFGQGALAMRIAVGQGPSAQTATWYAAQQAVNLAADGVWHHVEFGLSENDMTCVNGACGAIGLADVLADVTELRILSAAGTPDFRGDSIAATLGVDNIMAVASIGDVNRDGEINGLDVNPFVGVILSGVFQAEADANRDGNVDGLDVNPFVAAVLSGGGAQQIPEPLTFDLAAICLLSLSGWSWCRRPR